MHLTKAPMDLRRVFENVCAEVPDRDVMLTERSVAVREGEYWQVVVAESIVRGRYLLAGAQALCVHDAEMRARHPGAEIRTAA